MACKLVICWCIVESTIIPPGFLKLFYLSFYIHPFFLFFFQIFLWLNQLWTCLLRLIRSLHRLTSTFVTFFYTSKPPITTTTTTTTSAHATAARTVKRPDINVVKQTLISQHKSYLLINHHRYLITETGSEFQMSTVVESNHLLEENHHHMQESLNEEEEEEDVIDEATEIISQHDHLSSSFSSSTYPLTISSSSLQFISTIAVENLEEDMSVLDMEEESDPFYQKYSDRMKWFDKLNQDRAFAIGEILERELDTPQNPNMTSSSSSSSLVKKMAVLLRSLESDLELVYVAHSCLSWDALYHQYKKVEDVRDQNMNMDLNYNYSTVVADRFQKFQILLERFTEENDSKKKMRHFNYVHSRLISFNTLLQVPPLSDQEVLIIGSMSEGSSAIEVVKGIEKCVEAFWQFIRTANNNKKKKKWRFPWIGSPMPVEDPRDIKLFLELTKTLKKKEMWMKELQGKRRCCVRKLAVRAAAAAMEEESEKKVMLFTMIEMKLVAMVLNMSIVSSSHLKWCQNKLNSIHFTHEGRIITTSPSSSSFTAALFPVS